MTSFIDQKAWRQALGHPDWYLRLDDEWQRVVKLADEVRDKDPARAKRIKGEAYGLIEAALGEGLIPFADSGPDFDQQRRPIDTVIIHHSKNRPGMSLDRLNAIQLLTLYAKYYRQPKAIDKHWRGRPIWSNHFRDGKMVFWGYHWFIRADGRTERLLADDQIGWQAGCWHINTRSLAIAFDDDLSHSPPTPESLTAAAQLIRQQYPEVSRHNVIGHCEVNQTAAGPGDKFLDGWKRELLDQCFGS